MFTNEAKMAKPVIQWMKSRGLEIKPEFITPWGTCDLVGLNFRKGGVAARRHLGQSQPINSLTRAALLLSVPEHKTIALETLRDECAPVISVDVFSAEIERLVTEGFVTRSARGRLRRLNGWMPLHKRIVAIELKLNRIEEAMSQARNNLSFAEKSYVALPMDVASRVKSRPSRWATFIAEGVGVLSVTPESCDISIASRRGASSPDPILQFYCVEKFWRTHPRRS